MADTPNTPWSMLGLEPASANARMVKQAYAKKIKECRPDTDPEGFQKLHAAYQFALNWLQQQEAASEQEQGDMPLESEASAPIGEEDQSLPEHFRMAKEDLRQSIASADWAACKTKLDAWKAQIKQEPDLIHAWHDALIDLFNEHADFLTDYMSPADVRWLLEANCEAGPHHFVTLWYLKNQSNKLRVLANLLLETNTQMDVPAVIKQLVRLVEILAHHDVMFAGKLLNLVYPKLPPEVREWLVPQLETRISVARTFRILPANSRFFWDRRLFPLNHERVDWNEDQTAQEFSKLSQIQPSTWPGYGILKQAIPQEIYDDLIYDYPPRKLQKSYYRSEKKPQKDYGWLVWLFVMLIGLIVRTSSSNHRLTENEMKIFSKPVDAKIIDLKFPPDTQSDIKNSIFNVNSPKKDPRDIGKPGETRLLNNDIFRLTPTPTTPPPRDGESLLNLKL